MCISPFFLRNILSGSPRFPFDEQAPLSFVRPTRFGTVLPKSSLPELLNLFLRLYGNEAWFSEKTICPCFTF